jgi:hypothetical protein
VAKRTKTQFIVVRNGEHIAVCDTEEAAGRKLEEAKQEVIRLYQAGWFTSNPEQFNYYVFSR